MFSASRSPASLLLVCVPPRPTAAWLLLRSVVPYHSLYLLLLLRPSHQVRLLFLSTSLLSLGYPSPTPPGLFLTGYFNAQISGFRYPSPAPPRLFLTGYFNAQISGFRYPSPAPPRLFLTGYFDAQVSLFRYPGAFFSLPVLVSLIVCFDALLFSHPTFPSRLLGWPARSLCRLAVRLRFLPLRGFYRSAVFIAPLSPVCWGLCSSAALMLAAPQSSPTSGRLALCAALRYACDFCRSAVFTAPRFLPLCGFLPLRFRRFFGGLCSSAALLLAAPQSSSSSGRTLWCRLVRSVSGGPPFLTLFLYRLLNHSRSVAAHLTGFPFVHFIQIRGPSIVSSFECRDTGTACTSTSLWNLTAHGNKAFSPQTDGSAVCRYAYWSMKWLYLQMARSQSVVWFPPHSPDTRSPGPRDSLTFNWNILLHLITL